MATPSPVLSRVGRINVCVSRRVCGATAANASRKIKTLRIMISVENVLKKAYMYKAQRKFLGQSSTYTPNFKTPLRLQRSAYFVLSGGGSCMACHNNYDKLNKKKEAEEYRIWYSFRGPLKNFPQFSSKFTRTRVSFQS